MPHVSKGKCVEAMTISMTHSSAIRIVLVDSNVECLARLDKWIATHPDLEIVGKASSGVDALEQCKILRPDLVIMDVTLPVMNGYEATARIKEDGSGPKVILMSFFHMDEVYAHDDHSMADVVLKKDALYEELIPTVTRLFPSRAGTQGDRSLGDKAV